MTCPICRKPTLAAHKPFCSRRCADLDLARWVTGSYVIRGGDEEEDERPDPQGERGDG